MVHFVFGKDCRVSPDRKHEWVERMGLDKDRQPFKWHQCRHCGKKPTDRG